jgi:hypothetical protein
LVFDVNQRVGGSKIDREIVGKDAKEGIEHQQAPSRGRKKTFS